MINKQKKIIIIVSIIAAILAVAYFAIVLPIVNAVTEEEPPELLPGEILGPNNRILLMEHIENADLARLEVHNANGGYTFYRYDIENIYLEGMEGTPFDMSALSSIIVSAGYTLATERLTTDCQDFSEYGLAEEDDPAWYEITTVAGNSHKIYIGDALVTGAGYYCKYEGRNAVYVLDPTMSVLLESVNNFITPLLSYPVSTASGNSFDDFYLIRDNEIVVWIDYLKASEISNTATAGEYRFKIPAQYAVNPDSTSVLLQTFSGFYGEEVVLAGTSTENLDEKMLLEDYGINLNTPDYELHYSFNGISNYMVFSSQDEYGYMYVYSSFFNFVVRIHISSVQFIDWGLLQFVDDPVFRANINDIASIRIQGRDIDATFTLNGEGETILITASNGDGPYLDDDLKNFRQFYKSLLSMKVEDYTETSDISSLECMATFTIVTDAGVKYEYRFYPYSTRRCFYTLNGYGEFYTLRDQVDKILNDTVRILNGEPVNSDAKE